MSELALNALQTFVGRPNTSRTFRLKAFTHSQAVRHVEIRKALHMLEDLNPFAFCDDGIIRHVPDPVPEDDADSAGRKLGMDVLMLLSPAGMVALATNITKLQSESNSAREIALTNGLPIAQALWWFVENVQDDAPHKPGVYFHLRARVKDEIRD